MATDEFQPDGLAFGILLFGGLGFGGVVGFSLGTAIGAASQLIRTQFPVHCYPERLVRLASTRNVVGLGLSLATTGAVLLVPSMMYGSTRRGIEASGYLFAGCGFVAGLGTGIVFGRGAMTLQQKITRLTHDYYNRK